MKIIIIGGEGTIGKKVSAHLALQHEVLIGSRTKGDFLVDISNTDSIQAMYESISNIDAVVCIAGEAKWKEFGVITEEEYYIGIKSKLMGQVNLVRIGQHFINPNGSFTLTTGVLADDPVVKTTSAAMVNGGIHSFVKAAALELTNGMRINAVCAGLAEDSAAKYADYFPGHNPVPMQKIVNGYIKSIAGKMNGEIIRVDA